MRRERVAITFVYVCWLRRERYIVSCLTTPCLALLVSHSRQRAHSSCDDDGNAPFALRPCNPVLPPPGCCAHALTTSLSFFYFSFANSTTRRPSRVPT